MSTPIVLTREGRANQYYIDILNPKKNEERFFSFENFYRKSYTPKTSDDFTSMLMSQKENNTVNIPNGNFAPNIPVNLKAVIGKRSNDDFERLFSNERFKNEISICYRELALLDNSNLLDKNFFDRFNRKTRQR